MGKVMGWLRNLVQLKILLAALFARYKRILSCKFKLLIHSLKLIFVSVNYLTALILVPAIVFYITHRITKEYMIPMIVALISIVVYIIILSNYFTKGVHKFGSHAKEIKQMYHFMKMEHKLALHSLKEDPASGRLLFVLSFIIVMQFILFFNLWTRFAFFLKIRSILLVFLMIQIAFVLIEYGLSGHGLFPKKIFKLDHVKKIKHKFRRKEEDNSNIPSNFIKSEGFDDLIIIADDKTDNNDEKDKNSGSNESSDEYIELKKLVSEEE